MAYHRRVNKSLSKFSFPLELFFNGIFILFYSFKFFDRVPKFLNLEQVEQVITFGTYLAPIIISVVIVFNFLGSRSLEEYVRNHIFSITVFIPLLITWGDSDFAFWMSSTHLLSTIISLYDKTSDKKQVADTAPPVKTRFKFKPAQLVIISFFSVIFIGTFLLMLPVSSAEGKAMGLVDAIFMATSATCVTGLTTKSLSTDLSFFGQIVILILIQIGGLSIMTLYSSLTILLGQSMGMKNRVMMQDLLDVSSLEDLFVMVMDIIKYTFFIELWGGIVLTIAFTFEGFEFGNALYYGFFHSISAFCNAGFSLFDTSLESYATQPLIHGTIAILIILGGLGFIVLKELREVITKGKKFVRMGVHSKVVLTSSLLLTIAAAIFIFFGEFLHALDNYSLWEKIQISFFQSVTLRTAGFNTIPLTNLHTYTLYIMTLVMFIGGSPGSTAGGVKTTTLAILVQSIMSTLKGDKKVQVFDRTIPSHIVVRAIALVFISIIFTSFFIFIMMKLEPNQSFLSLFFEVISASGTVGLSLGITPFLSTAGKLAISMLMFTGRIGPLTLILAIGQQEKSIGKYDYPDGRVMIG